MLRLAAAYLAVFVVVLAALDVAAYAYVAHADADVMQPLLALPEGRAAYATVMHRVALGLVLADVPLLILVGTASYVLARISLRPLVIAGEHQRRFAAEAAHELRTPLARIAATAQEAAPDALGRITAIALDASATVDDLLTLVREEHVPARLAEPVDLAAVVRRELADQTRDGIVFRADLTPAYVLGDERRLRRLAANLVNNALRHARAFVDVRVAAERDTVTLRVEDDGAGVPEALRATLFERFVREDGGGSGLGLAICRAIARAHGGDVALEDRARFVARLPRLRDGS